MSRTRTVAVLLAIVGAAVVAVPSAPASQRSFFASITEEFCGQGETCGTALTTVGPATAHTVITNFFPLPAGCFHDEHTTTLSFGASTLAVGIVGTLCPTTGQNFTFLGAFRVVSGTGRFAGATGSGLDRASRNDGPVHAALSGTLRTR